MDGERVMLRAGWSYFERPNVWLEVPTQSNGIRRSPSSSQAFVYGTTMIEEAIYDDEEANRRVDDARQLEEQCCQARCWERPPDVCWSAEGVVGGKRSKNGELAAVLAGVGGNEDVGLEGDSDIGSEVCWRRVLKVRDEVDGLVVSRDGHRQKVDA